MTDLEKAEKELNEAETLLKLEEDDLYAERFVERNPDEMITVTRSAADVEKGNR